MAELHTYGYEYNNILLNNRESTDGRRNDKRFYVFPSEKQK